MAPVWYFLVFGITALWSKPIPGGCEVLGGSRAGIVLMACRSGDGLKLSLIDSSGQVKPVEGIKQDVSQTVVDVGSAAWSPAGDYAALEIGFDEEPGVLLIDARTASAVLLDTSLAKLNVSAAQPQWSESGEWLLFRTVGNWRATQ